MAFGLVSLEKRLKENIKNYGLDQLMQIEKVSDYLEAVHEISGLSILLVDRHGEKMLSYGNFAGFKPDVRNAPGMKIRVQDRTVGHIYVKEEEIADNSIKKQFLEGLVEQLAFAADQAYASMETSLYADELEKMLEKEQYQVKHGEKKDPLTGALNSTYFDNKMKVLDRSEVVPVAVICANINDWKYVNDRFGDEESDRLIQTVARLIEKEAKEEYVIARCGGDMFNVLIPMPEEGEADEFVTRIKDACNSFEDDVIAPSIACGMVYKENVEQKLADLLPDAEYEMFNDKFEIKNAPGYRERLEKK